MDISSVKKIYFIGIGGIGMSALARYYLNEGKKVYGYDRDKNTLTKKLEAEGMIIHYKEDIEKIPVGIDLVIYTPAIPDTHIELLWFRENGYSVIKRAKALGQISRHKQTLAIAGTHGKTTTSSVLSHILTVCNTGATSLVGGLMVNYDGNFIYGNGNYLVTEADEYDRSFHQLDVCQGAIMSLDADHLDIYETYENMLDAFAEFAMQIRKDGNLYIKKGMLDKFSKSTVLKLIENNIDIVDFGAKDASLYVENMHMKNGHFVFDIHYKGDHYPSVVSILPGAHNAENVSVAFAMALDLGLLAKDIINAIVSFKGIKRRYECILENDDIVIIDDYAHHPTELNAAIATAKMMYPDKKLTVIFQAHLYSRTKDFYKEFGDVLSNVDDLVLLDIYPAREKPIKGVTSQLILNEVTIDSKIWIKKEELKSYLESKDIELLLILGAGDIHKEIEKIKNIYN